MNDNVNVPQCSTSVVTINWPREDRLRMRRVVTRAGTRTTGKYPSWKAGRMVQWTSSAELSVFKFLDSTPEVVTFAEQPCEVVYRDNGVERRHYPDVLVHWRDHKELWEVKVAKDSQDPEVVHRTALLSAGMPTFGYAYRLVVAEDVSGTTKFSNGLELLKLGRKSVSLEEREALRRLFAQMPTIPWSAFAAGTFGVGTARHVARLLLEGVLSTDLSVPLRAADVSDASRFCEGRS